MTVAECLIDNVEVRNAANVNLVTNSTFEVDAAGWFAEGTEDQSGLDTTTGYNSSKCYHVRAVERGDNQMNRIRTSLAAGIAANTTDVINAQVRWLRGTPSILFRIRGIWLEAFCSMNLPINLGTPGLLNSRAATNAPPAISDVSHSPIVPPASQPVVVTARANDPDGLASLTLR